MWSPRRPIEINSIMNIYLDDFQRNEVVLQWNSVRCWNDSHKHICIHSHIHWAVLWSSAVTSRHNATRNSTLFWIYLYSLHPKKCNRHSWKILVIAFCVSLFFFFWCVICRCCCDCVLSEVWHWNLFSAQYSSEKSLKWIWNLFFGSIAVEERNKNTRNKK